LKSRFQAKGPVQLLFDDADLQRRVQIPKQGVHIGLTPLDGSRAESEGDPLGVGRSNSGAETVIASEEDEIKATRENIPLIGDEVDCARSGLCKLTRKTLHCHQDRQSLTGF